MSLNTSQTRLFLGSIVTMATAIGAVSFWYYYRSREGAAPPRSTKCSIVFLSIAERSSLEREKEKVFLSAPKVSSPDIPESQASNPILHESTYAVVRFANKTDHSIELFVLKPIERTRNSFFLGTKPATGEEPAGPTIRNALIVRVDIVGPGGVVPRPYGRQRYDHISYLIPQTLPEPSVPSPADLRARNAGTVALKSNESVDMPISILGGISHREQGLEAGTYTIRATVSYVEAPSGETKSVTSEPVTVTVTEEHIKAAEAYWAALKK